MKTFLALLWIATPVLAELKPVGLRTEWLEDPLCVEAEKPRLSWRVEESDAAVHGQRQNAYRILAATSREALKKDAGDLWDTGKVPSMESLSIPYGGKPLASGQEVFWKVMAWDKDGKETAWSADGHWAMGLLKPDDWKAQWISFKDDAPLPADRSKLHLPPARYYRKPFRTEKAVRRATIYASALGIADLWVNEQRTSDDYFAPGWSDYHQRAYYRAYDVTARIKKGPNCLGAVVADGWYAGYVGYGLLVGYGPNRTGRNIYGKTPALLAQLELEYEDGSRETMGTDESWMVSADGPEREADLIMGEVYDAQSLLLLPKHHWCSGGPEPAKPIPPKPGQPAIPVPQEPDILFGKWSPAIRATENGQTKAKSYEPGVERNVELGFQKPPRLAAYTAPPIRVTEELPATKITEPKPGVYVFDFGQNFAGNIRLKLKGEKGAKLTLRYGEMLHPDGRLMTENLRRARATDTYIFSGNGEETWTPRFTYHGFQYCEVTGLKERPGLSLLTGLVLNNDTPMAGEFACSDEVMTQFWRNTVRTQKANFIELPTDCPQRDERLGWMGDAQIYARTATYHADVAAFFTKWIDDVREAQRPSGAYPDYAPYPFAHGAPKANQGTAWTDAGVLVPYAMWEAYGDLRLLEKHWDSMVKFMDWRLKSDPELKGVKIGNTWGDWLNVNEDTPIEYIDLCYHARSCACMTQMAQALGKEKEAEQYVDRLTQLAESFLKQHIAPDSSLKVDTQTACVLALWSRMEFFFPYPVSRKITEKLVKRIESNDYRMATGFLGTKALLGVLTENGQHDLACRLFQSRKFPSWGYEVEQGATSVWERWDSFTKEHGFEGATGKNNAAMNSFSHYAFGAVMEWAFADLAGIRPAPPVRDPERAGGMYLVQLTPHVPSITSNPDGKPLTWVTASYQSPVGKIVSNWKRVEGGVRYEFVIPANARGQVIFPGVKEGNVTVLKDEKGAVPEVKRVKEEGEVKWELEAGRYGFEVKE
jgi:alpha-L-rhamnosidase